MRISLLRIIALPLLLIGPRFLHAQIQGAWTNTGNMNSIRELAAQVVLANGKVIVVGGTDGNNILSSAEIYNPATGVWTATGNMSEAREAFQAVVLKSGKVLVAGGLGTGGVVLTGAELYDPATGKWSAAGSLSTGRFDHTVTLLKNGKVLVAGGCSANNCGTTAAAGELYNPTANAWSTTGSLITPRYNHTATLLGNGDVLIVDGATTTSRATQLCELYNPSTGAWSSAANTNVARVGHAISLLSDGKVLVSGGYGYSSAEIYNPAANTWTLTGNMTVSRIQHSATLLTDGTVLIAGGGTIQGCGRVACYRPSASAEVYNETTATFTRAGTMNWSRWYHQAALLKTGRVLVSGGGDYFAILNTSEFYTPLTLTFSSSSLGFGPEQVGLTSSAQTITVTNVSSHSVAFTSIASGPDYPETNTCPTTLNAGQNCTITVSFKPTVSGNLAENVTLKDNCPGDPQQTINLSGTGEPYPISFSASSLTFPGTLPGSSSYPMSVTLINDGAGTVSIANISVSPTDGTFTQTNNCPATLNPGQSCTIQVVFTPPDEGTKTATLSATDAAGHTVTVALSGIGLD